MKKTISIFITSIFMLFTLRILWTQVAQGNSIIFALVLSGALLALSYGLIKEQKWAFRGLAFIVLMIAIILPCGIFSPFSVGDYLAVGKKPPEIKETLLWMIPVEILLLAVVFILDPRKENKLNNLQRPN